LGGKDSGRKESEEGWDCTMKTDACGEEEGEEDVRNSKGEKKRGGGRLRGKRSTSKNCD